VALRVVLVHQGSGDVDATECLVRPVVSQAKATEVPRLEDLSERVSDDCRRRRAAKIQEDDGPRFRRICERHVGMLSLSELRCTLDVMTWRCPRT
jgi:hypothetical protein